MFESLDPSLVDWSRAQFALTAMYHWIFVPLTLGLGIIMAIMESVYYKTGDEFWKQTAKFWMKLFGINFAIGVATGLILEFQFGSNWSNYSWFVGDIFGAPLAIEGILAFFMEATFIAVMFFGWNKVSKRFHLASTWLTILGATMSAWWILVANAWMEYPIGMAFNPETVRNEMVDFWAIALSPVAVNKFFHTVLSGWMLGAAFAVGVSCWFLLKNRELRFAKESIKIAAVFGLTASLLTAFTGDSSGAEIAQVQPMKLAAMEAHYEGTDHAGLVIIGLLNSDKKAYNDGIPSVKYNLEIPYGLSFLANRDINSFVPGIKDLIDGGYTLKDGSTALSATEKMAKGKLAIQSLANFRAAKKAKNDTLSAKYRAEINENYKYFGYGFIADKTELIPHVPSVFYAFRLMVGIGVYFIGFFALLSFWAFKDQLGGKKWLYWLGLISIFFAHIAGQAGWVVSEMGRQPWTIQDVLPRGAAISRLDVSTVQATFFIFLGLFTVLLIAEVGIMLKAIKQGPEIDEKGIKKESN